MKESGLVDSPVRLHRAVNPVGGTRGWFAACDACEWTGRVRSDDGSAATDRDKHEVMCKKGLRK